MNKLLQNVIEGLRQRPAYLLILGVCILALGGGGAGALIGLIKSNNDAIWAGVFVFVVAVIVGGILVFRIEALVAGGLKGAIGGADLGPILDAVHKNITSALGFGHPVFQEWVKQECQDFLRISSYWSRGELSLSQRRYNQLLLLVYEKAQVSVVATSTPNYFETWQSTIGDEISKAHGTSPAKEVERIFIFSSLSDIPSAHIPVMKRQQEGGKVKVRVWGNKDDVTYEIPNNVNPNFAYIDNGEVIAFSSKGDSGEFSGSFYFKDRDKKQSYVSIIENLRKGSISLDDYLSKQKAPVGEASSQ